jgi:translocation and assembly module TamB
VSRPKKIALIIGGAILGLVVIVFVAGIVVVQTQWFRDTVREKIVSAVETGTGGRAEMGSFAFDWKHLRAQVRNFVIHGLEPAGAAPLFRADLVQVDLKLTSPFKNFVDIAYLLAEKPQANVIVYPDGHTNVPSPKTKSTSNKTGLETVVDLAVRRFDLRGGNLTLAERKTAFDARGEKLRAQLAYSAVNPSYTGEIDMSPLYLSTCGAGLTLPTAGPAQACPTLNVDVKLPLKLEKDKISLANAQLSTAQSQVIVSGAMERLSDPITSAHVKARLALDEVKQAAGLTMPLDTARGPRILNADIAASMGGDRIQVESARIDLGRSNIEASGTLQDPNRPGSMRFNASLALAEIGRLMRVAAQPEGTVRIGGNAALRAGNEYAVTAKVEGRDIAFRQNGTRIAGISLDTNVAADPRRIDVNGLRLAALGGTVAGSGALENLAQYQFKGSLQNFDIAQVMRAFSPNKMGYDGIVSGRVQAQGDLKNASGLAARANLSIAPGPRGVPLSGRLNVDYNGRGDTVTVGQSYLQLPHTRVDLSGSLGQQIQVRLVTRDFADFKPVADIPVAFNGGAATADATVRGKLSDPRIAGRVAMNNFSVGGRPFTRLAASLDASRNNASVGNAVLANGPLQAQFSGSVGLRDWKPEDRSPLRVDASVRNADVRDVLALAGQKQSVTGALTADAHITGTVGDPRGSADLNVVNGAIEGEHFDSLVARASIAERSIDVPTLQLVAGPSRIDANVAYQHPPNDLKRGSLRAHVASNNVQLANFQSLVKDRPGLKGTLTLSGDVAADIQPAPSGQQFQLVSLNANASARNLQMEGKSLGDFTATATSAGPLVRYNVNSNLAGSSIRVNGQSEIAGNHQTSASVTIANLPMDSVLALAGRRDVPVTGTLAATAQLSGTLDDPRASGNLNVTNGAAYQERFDQLQAAIGYSNQLVEIPSLRFTEGSSVVELSASLAHPAGDLQSGQLKFHVRSNQLQLARFHTVRQFKPGLAGVVELAADGAATLRHNAAPLFSTLDATIAAKGVSVDRKPVGDLTATAATRGREVEFNLASDFTRADIRGSGRMQLAGDYPLNAQLTFSNVTYSGLSNWTGQTGPATFDGAATGQVNISGPVLRTDALKGTARISTLEAHPVKQAGAAQPRADLHLRNQGDIVIELERSALAIRSFRIAGPGTTLSLAGSAPLQGGPMNLRAEGNVKLDIVQAFDPDIFAAGNIALNAAVTGAAAKPVVNGRLQLENASLNAVDAPNGLSNANGTIAFTGTEAIIQNLTGESGGGKITLAGFVGYGGPQMQVRLQASADKVRVHYPETVSTQVSAKLTLAGSASRSLLTGNVSILDVSLRSHSDVGSMLSEAAAPLSSPTPSTGFLAGIRFDVKIQTAPNLQFRTSLTQNLQADANLTLRGSVDHPGMLGNVAVTRGEVVFFGSEYAIDQGTVTFNDPQKINPVLNIHLATSVQGIDVSIGVSGPMDRLKMSYRSDPPMLFSDLVSLLASGKAPTTDPVLAAHTPAAPQQNLEQMGASRLLGQAVANPVSGRLQRLFGVSKLKIDPQILGASNTPQATLTLQQQITRDLTFTYIQEVTQSNPQAVRIEWSINPQWSAIAQRDVNGIFDLDVYYKRRFR